MRGVLPASIILKLTWSIVSIGSSAHSSLESFSHFSTSAVSDVTDRRHGQGAQECGRRSTNRCG